MEVDGLVVRLDVRVDDVQQASTVAETLARMAAGFAADGQVASIIVHPARIVVDADIDVAGDDPEDPDR